MPLSTRTAGPGAAWPFLLGVGRSTPSRSGSTTAGDLPNWRRTSAPARYILAVTGSSFLGADIHDRRADCAPATQKRSTTGQRDRNAQHWHAPSKASGSGAGRVAQSDGERPDQGESPTEAPARQARREGWLGRRGKRRKEPAKSAAESAAGGGAHHAHEAPSKCHAGDEHKAPPAQDDRGRKLRKKRGGTHMVPPRPDASQLRLVRG